METRQAKRLPISAIAKLKVNSPAQQHFDIAKDDIEGKIIDISIKGIGLLSKYFIPKGIIIDFEFKISDKLISGKGEIRSAIPGGKGLTRLGLKFIDIDNKQRQIIENFIKENERRVEPRLGV